MACSLRKCILLFTTVSKSPANVSETLHKITAMEKALFFAKA